MNDIWFLKTIIYKFFLLLDLLFGDSTTQPSAISCRLISVTISLSHTHTALNSIEQNACVIKLSFPSGLSFTQCILRRFTRRASMIAHQLGLLPWIQLTQVWFLWLSSIRSDPWTQSKSKPWELTDVAQYTNKQKY